MELEPAADRLTRRREEWLAAGWDVSLFVWGPRGAAPIGDGTNAGDSVAALVGASDRPVRLFIKLNERGHATVAYYEGAHEFQSRHRVGSLEDWDDLLGRAVERASRIRLLQGQLVALSCTTGWLDLRHGDLWVLPGAMVRIRKGLLDTIAHCYGTGHSARKAARTLAYDPVAILGSHPTNKVIPFADIESARLHRGFTTSGLTVRMTDGTRHKLLWQSAEPAHRLLTDRLLPILGPRLVA